MESSRKSRPSAKRNQAAVRAPTLQEALREAQMRYGEEVRIVQSRTIHQRQEEGLGQEKMVEVVVETGRQQPTLSALSAPDSTPRPQSDSHDLVKVIEGEVTRIERLVQQLAGRHHPAHEMAAELHEYPLATPLLAAGASLESVRRLASAFAAEVAGQESNLPAAVKHLRSAVHAGQSDWQNFSGCHVFLGDHAAGKSDLVLALAAKLRRADRNVLVLNLLPKHGGEIRRLQLEAAEHSYDAAIIKHGEQIARVSEHLARYEAVLIDTPSVYSSAFREAGDLQGFIAQNEMFHRHFVVPLDIDLTNGSGYWEAARHWNCDWAVLTRLDRSRGPGKILDLQSRLQLPFSLGTVGPWPEQEPFLAESELLADLILKHQTVQSAEAAEA